ncbi:MAG: 23S rRNA (guanosine(2251)-2'-O)-methyltransferase RlmB [Rickettsiales bacterium]
MHNNYYIYGIHAVTSALLNEKRNILNIFIANEDILNDKLFDIIKKRNLQIKYVSKPELSRIVNSDFHQGIAILTNSIAIEFDKNIIKDMNRIVILDQISDANNLGAILRSSAFFGIDCIILPKDNSVRESATVAKVASGGLEVNNIVYVTNINKIINELKKLKFWIVGLDERGENFDSNFFIDTKVAIIFGAEGKGIRPLVLNNCDKTFAIKNLNKQKHIVSSLNVATTAAIVFALIS